MSIQDYEPIIALVGIFVAVVVPLYIYLKQRSRKSLIIEELQNSALIGVADRIKDKVEIKYSGNLVSNLYLSTFRVRNNGNVSIKKSDIVSPIKIKYDEEFIECSVINVFPRGIDVDLNDFLDGHSVDCVFNLLNPGDYFVLQFVSLERLTDPLIESRIDGLPNVTFVALKDKSIFDNISESFFDNISESCSTYYNNNYKSIMLGFFILGFIFLCYILMGVLIGFTNATADLLNLIRMLLDIIRI